MKPNLLYLLVLACLALSGCVTSGTFRQKQLEAEKLDKSLKEQRGEYEMLEDSLRSTSDAKGIAGPGTATVKMSWMSGRRKL